ncbi:MAG TPA: ABC transporter permease subunit, partial [Candidatus Saccharimonadales bacterium]
MNWLAWRQHRKQFMVIGIFLVIFAAVTIPTGLHFWHTYQQAISTCKTTGTCNQLNGELFQSNLDGLLFHFIPLVVLLLPIIFGLFWGVPFLAREYSEGTNKLVWTQSISRRKWLTVKLIWVLLGAAILTAGFTVLDTWWFKTGNALNQNRFGNGFSTQGIVPVSYSIFAVSLGIMFGAWFKRTMVALGVTLFLLIAIVLILVPNGLRPYYETPLNYKVSLTNNVVSNGPTPFDNGPVSGAALILDQNPVSSTGQALNWSNPPSKCILLNPGTPEGHAEAIKQVAGSGPNVAIISRNGGPAINMNCLGTLG